MKNSSSNFQVVGGILNFCLILQFPYPLFENIYNLKNILIFQLNLTRKNPSPKIEVKINT